jgi:hypothetical protein
MRRGLTEGLKSALTSPIAAASLGLLGFASAVIGALADEAAAAITAAAVLVALTALLIYALRVKAAFDGPYKVLESETLWDLRDPDGSVAVMTKTQRVRFYYSTPVMSDRAWNDTGCDPFRDYSADHGTKVGTTINHGSEYHAIIQLYSQAERGDDRTLASYRTERDQFPKPHDEWIELKQSQRGPSAMTVIFPTHRPPHNVRLWRSKHNRTVELNLPTEGGRKVYRLPKVEMAPGEQYILKWDWQPRSNGSAGP